jgi:hypothetical protein
VVFYCWASDPDQVDRLADALYTAAPDRQRAR